jgi:chromate transporter
MKKFNKLSEVAKVFATLGFLAFGGPAAHIAMMRKEVVQKRQWISEEHFLDLIGATNLIPGPNSTEMAIHIGYERAGWKGLFVAGACFILPAVAITGLCAWAYQKYGSLPSVIPFIYGIKPAIIAVIVSLMISFGRTSLKSFQLGIIGLVTAIASISGLNEIYSLFGAGFLGILFYLIKNRINTFQTFTPFAVLHIINLLIDQSRWCLFWVFLKVGAILYGSGYMLFAFLDTELVKKGILSRQVLIDAIAVGQFTPGPVFSSATFIGWQLGGLSGAILATIGIFLPSFIFVAFLNPLIPKLRKSQLISAFLDAANIASVAIILSVCITMARESINDWRTITIAVLGMAITFLFDLNNAYIILGGAIVGYLLWLF